MNIRWISSRAAYYEREDEQGGDQDDEEEEEDQEGGKKRKGTSVEQSQKQSQAGEKGQKGQKGENTVGDGGNRLYENFTKPFRDSLRSPLQPLMEVI